jgi:leucyl/phenylalanyl-tRNA---protein transferase
MKRIHWISADAGPDQFPDANLALEDPPGLLAGGGDLSTARLLAAYRRGIFPWYLPGQPVLWWSPDPREVLFPAQFHASRSLQRRIRRGDFQVTMDRDFEAVIDACAAPRNGQADPEPGTWITPEMREAYVGLARSGQAHSIEVWQGRTLAGGLYGVQCGRVFSGESMFSRLADASKVALAHLVAACPARGIEVIDCQMPSAHLRSLGSRPLPRREFLALL